MKPAFSVSLMKIELENVNAIDSMVVGDDRKIYLGLSCNPPKYLLASLDPADHSVEDCGVKFNFNKLHNSLIKTTDGKIYGGTWSWIKIHDNECRYSDFEGGHLFCYDPANKLTTDLGRLFRHEQIFALALDPKEEYLYGITFPLKRFFSFHLSEQTLEDIIELKGPIGDTTSHQIACDNRGNVWGTQADGTFFKYEAEEKKFIETSLRLPEKEYHVDSIVMDKERNLLFGGTVQNGLLFSLDPDKESLRIITKAGSQDRLPAIAIDKDGIIFGATGSTIASYFMYDPNTDTHIDFGPIKAEIENITAFRIHSIAIDHEGTLFFGESDRYPYLYICTREK